MSGSETNAVSPGLAFEAKRGEGAPALVPQRYDLVKLILRPVEIIAAALLLGIIVLVTLGLVFRYFLSNPLVWIDELLSLAFIWMCMLGSSIAIDRGEHIRLSLFADMFPGRLQPFIKTISVMIVSIFLGALIIPAAEHANFEAIMTSTELGISRFYYLTALTFGMGAMLAITVLQLWQRSSVSDMLKGMVTLALVFVVFWHFRGALAELGNYNILVFIVGFSLVSIIIGVPIAFCFGIGTISFLFFVTSVPITVMIGRIDEGISNPVLLSIPVFILLGCILDRTGMGKAIVAFLSAAIGHFRGGMSYVLLGSLYLVSGISGSKVSDMATVAPALFPEMKRRGNKPPEMVALLATGAIMADTVPPSIVLIVLGSVAGVSIGGLFTSGFVIALFLLVILAAVARWKSRSETLQGVRRAPLSLIGWSLLIASPALALPFFIRAAVAEGFATATEVSTVAVLYSLLIGFLLYDRFSWKTFYRMLVDTASLSGAILLIMGTALAAAWALTQTGFAFELSNLLKALPGGWVTFMFVSIMLFMSLGCLLEGMPALVLLAPIMFPIARSLNIDGVHYGMVAVVAINIGMFMPPLGVGYYLACSIGRVPPEEAIKGVWIYLAGLIAGLVMIALVPAISLGIL